ncbi:MAG: cytochrome B6 [candidate division Zixibacteria bacterium RBG_16_53_22]|nr:MAG: cytochrome B6 [candidate division Zixibacteria bacterium RBG_16_53_22]
MSDWIQKIRSWGPVGSIYRGGGASSNLERSLTIFNNFFLHVLPVKVRTRSIRFSATLYLGYISFVLFGILVMTGILLMLYYRPAVPHAYQDMKDLKFVVSSGMFLRNMHRWAAHLMVIVVFLHMLRVFFAGAYRPPREFNWAVGVILLILTLLLSYTGYLLPWDQLAYWAVSVGANMVNATPIIGPSMKFILLGGHSIGENALVRFYVLHCVIIPLFAIMLIGVHFWRVRKDGGVVPLFQSTKSKIRSRARSDKKVGIDV